MKKNFRGNTYRYSPRATLAVALLSVLMPGVVASTT